MKSPPPLVGHHFIRSWNPVPPQSGSVQDYLVGGNGIYLRAKRPEFSAVVPWQTFRETLCGLDLIAPSFTLNVPKVPIELVRAMMEMAQEPEPFVETLFYFLWDKGEWHLIRPDQVGMMNEVRPIDPYCESHQKALIEVHSHPPGVNEFSSKDDQSAEGFRLFGLITHLESTPQLKMRVGIEQHFWEFPASEVFEVEPKFWIV